MNGYICYCFNYTKKDIVDDMINNNGESTILKKIVEKKKKGNCQCATKNPKGT